MGLTSAQLGVKRAVLALIYHDVAARPQADATGFPGPVAARYKLEPDAFSAHLRAIAATGVKVGCYAEQSPAMLTFDDGGASSSWIAAELERHGFRGTFFIVTDRLGTPGFLDPDEVRSLAERGHAIGSHSHTHPAYMARLDPDRLAQEWTVSRELLAELLGYPPAEAAVPGGSVSRAVIEQVALAGYERLYTSTPRSRPCRHGELTVLGRYTIWATDPPSRAAAFARGSWLPRARRRLGWELKSAAKRISPGAYERARSIRASKLGLDSSRNDASRAV